jgi:pyruvate carboxylase
MEETRMSTTTPEPVIEPTMEPVTAEPTQGDPADLGDAGKKALDAERAARKSAERAAADFKAELDKIQQANETAIEKAQREAKEATEVAATATATAFREAAMKFGGISQEDADLFLTGTDVDTRSKQAARLVERTPTSPLPDLSQGGKGTPSTGDPAKDFANFLGSQMGA